MSKTITATSKYAIEALNHAIEVAYDVEGDMLMDDQMYTAKQVRDLAAKSDDEINTVLEENRKLLNDRINRYIGLIELRAQLNS